MSDQNTLEMLRHSLSHIMAQAVLQMFPEAKLGIGPSIDSGFYYDFELPRTLIPEDLPLIEEKMRQIIKDKQTFVRREEPIAEAIEFCRVAGQPYKQELIEDLAAAGETIVSFYENFDKNNEVKFVDLCRGPHVEQTGLINSKSFKLDKIAGAYWRGDEKRPMLQRIYGLAFNTPEELADHLKLLEEAKKRDHRKLGAELGLFHFNSDLVGPGLPLWLPKGAAIMEELERLAKETEFDTGYVRVRTPHLAKEKMYKTSGHLPYYADSMFAPIEFKESPDDPEVTRYYLKSMNCPHHHCIFAAETRSYRDLPLRLAEYGTCYRYEQSGELFGLMRVRSMQMNDAHIYCTPEQFADEFRSVNNLYIKYFKIFGIEKYVMRFSTHDPARLGEKYVNEPEMWKQTEDMVRRVMIESGINFVEVPNEAAFYGPKIDVQVWSAIGREFTIATNQVDFAVPRRFGLTYTDKDGSEKTPLCIHRAPLSTHERFIGFLIEHYAGAFPNWLAPVQVKILPVSDNHLAAAHRLAEQWRADRMRIEVDDANDTLGKKIRNAEMQKVPYMVILGDKEVESGDISVRNYRTKEQATRSVSEFTAQLREEIANRQG